MWEFLNRVAVLVTILGTLGGVIWFFFSANARIETLEVQIQTLAGGVAVANASAGSSTGSSVDPIKAVCADLATKSAELETTVQFTLASRVNNLMEKLGCFPDT